MKRTTALLAILLAMTTDPALASNSGFVLSVDMAVQPGEWDTNLIALPYYYFPNGDILIDQFASDLILEFPYATSVSRIDPATGRVETWDLIDGRWMGDDFPLDPAEGVAMTVSVANRERLVGSHDDSFAGVTLVGGNGEVVRHLVGPPYHTKWDSSDDLLLALFDGTNRLTVATYRGGEMIERTISTGPTFSGDRFPLLPGEALELRVLVDTVFASPHYYVPPGRVLELELAREPVAASPVIGEGSGGSEVVGVTRFLDTLHTEGGPVFDATDGTRADGATWRIATRHGGSTLVTSGYPGEGRVGAAEPGYWWGHVGTGLFRESNGTYATAPGQDRMLAVDAVRILDGVEVGYYAVSNQDTTSAHPDVYAPVQLRPIPSPRVVKRPAGEYVVAWRAAEEDPGIPLRQNIVGYELYRALDRADFERVASLSADQHMYIDRSDPLRDRRRYAIRLVYRMGLRSAALSAPSSCTGPYQACGRHREGRVPIGRVESDTTMEQGHGAVSMSP